MSSILLSNPFVMPVPPPQSGGAETANTPMIAAAQGASGSANSGSATSYSGSGGGYGTGRGAPENLVMRAAFERAMSLKPSDATSRSVVDAQVFGAAQDAEFPVSVGPDLPEVEMPDPLPTSPFLLAMRGSD